MLLDVRRHEKAAALSGVSHAGAALFQETLLELRLRQHAMLSLAEPAVAVTRHIGVAEIAQRSRNDDGGIRQRICATQPPGNAQRCRGAGVGAPVLNQHNRADVVRGQPVLLEQLMSGSRLQGREAEVALRVIPQDELHSSAAQVADAVEQYDGFGWLSHGAMPPSWRLTYHLLKLQQVKDMRRPFGPSQ
ncbi:hypothetical protein [Paenibacillus planticolens]|uniref:hypothetical protein n=1 Tax=Paenibacillus planticolens TaxID=2654976 RepID=UPI00406BD571